jgi:hypothetical protein
LRRKAAGEMVGMVDGLTLDSHAILDSEERWDGTGLGRKEGYCLVLDERKERSKRKD